MAKSTDRNAARKRSSPLTDYHDASEPLGGFGEAPQAEFKGAPLSGSVSDWVRDLERAAEVDSRKSETRAIRSAAGTHRVMAERGDAGGPKPGKKIPERSSAPTRSGRGTSMGCLLYTSPSPRD